MELIRLFSNRTVNECHSMAMTVDSTRRIHQKFIWVYSLFDSNILCEDHRLFVDAWQKYIPNSVVFGVRMEQFYIQSCRLSNMDVQYFLCSNVQTHKHWQFYRELAVLSINECHVPPTSDVLWKFVHKIHSALTSSPSVLLDRMWGNGKTIERKIIQCAAKDSIIFFLFSWFAPI